MSYEIYESSNPYFVGAGVNEETTIITWGVDQLYVDSDTNEQKIITEFFDQELDETTT